MDPLKNCRKTIELITFGRRIRNGAYLGESIESPQGKRSDDPLSAEPSGEHHVYDDKTQIPFRRIRALGRGTYGAVDKVERTSGPRHGQIYARKTLWLPRDTSSEREKVWNSIQNEVNIVKGTRHTHVVCFIETYQFDREYAIIMTPVATEDLREYFNRVDDAPLDTKGWELRERIRPWFGCLVDVMADLHAQNIRHRDIKPPNILIENGDILLTDFGGAMQCPGETTFTGTSKHGTLKYVAPEVVEGYPSGRTADIFSLGTVFIEMLSVYSGPKQLARLNDFWKSHKDGSYASNAGRLSEWIEFLKTTHRDVPWYSTMLILCGNMLEIERDKRPSADNLRPCWLYQPSLAAPPTSCKSCRLADASNRDRTWLTGEALRKASSNGHKLPVCLLIKKGATINEINDSGALVSASEKGQKGIVQLLLSGGANVDAQEKNGRMRNKSGRTALHAAAESHHDELVLLLLENGANVEAKDNDRRTALHQAASKGHNTTIRLLLKYGASVAAEDYGGWTALHMAARNRHEEAMQLLIEKRADTKAKDKCRLTPQVLARRLDQETANRRQRPYVAPTTGPNAPFTPPSSQETPISPRLAPVPSPSSKPPPSQQGPSAQPLPLQTLDSYPNPPPPHQDPSCHPPVLQTPEPRPLKSSGAPVGALDVPLRYPDDLRKFYSIPLQEYRRRQAERLRPPSGDEWYDFFLR